MNKREFVLSGAALAVSGVAVATPPAQAQPVASAAAFARRPDLAAAPGLQAWKAYLGESFTLAGASLRLERVAEVRSDRHAEQFTLHFAQIAGSAAIVDGMRSLRHRNGQRVDLFLESASVERGVDCVAHFNRLI